MRSIGASLSVLVFFALAPDAAKATLFGGTWVPVESATAEYCLDGACADYPADASIALGPPPSPGVLGTSSLTIGFRPLGFEFFTATFGSVVDEATLAAGVLTIRGNTPGFEEHDFTIRIVSDRFLTLNGFLHVATSAGTFDTRFRDVGFVPVPEPSSALLVGSGLALLAGPTVGRRARSARDPGRARKPAPSA